MFRNVLRREIGPNASWSTDYPQDPFDLRWAAWGAAVETLQINLVANGWMGLFHAFLEPSPCSDLRWQGVGPGTNAEVKRAYSALFGRFFGRAALRHYHGCRWLRQVFEGLEIAPGIYLQRRPGHTGDLPDWIGWDDKNNCLVVAEAKGSYDAGNWHSACPAPIRTALAQLARVQIVDANGPIQFKNWAVACRWATSAQPVTPTIICCDPEEVGRQLTPREAKFIRAEIRSRWMADLLKGIGRQDLANVLFQPPQLFDIQNFERDMSTIAGRVGYGALAIESGGLIPLIGEGREAREKLLIEAARGLGRDVAFIMVNADAVISAILERSEPTNEMNLDSGAAPGDADITIDGITFRSISASD